ncbi:hypothetical protein BJ928_12344 [Rhizobium sp. WW_1]|jgi:hypothetical protein|nr:hypothetical protein BJ928_12344 [Rhizobium sp. WW_1]
MGFEPLTTPLPLAEIPRLQPNRIEMRILAWRRAR